MKIIALAVALAAPSVSAQIFPNPDKPVVTMAAGQPVRAVWTNGNEAELKFARSGLIRIPVEFQVHENLCNGITGAKFEMNFALRVDRVIWQWTKNSDAAKIGNTLVFKYGAFENPLLRYSFVTNAYRFKYMDLIQGLPWDEIEFEDLKWLPGFPTGALKPFTIGTWTSEAMIPNGQTDLSENRIVAQINDVHITPTGPLSGVIDGFSSGFSITLTQLESFAYLGDVSSWVWKNAEGPCLISFKPNIGKASMQLTQFISTLPEVYEPYLAEQDTLLETVESGFVQEELWYVNQ